MNSMTGEQSICFEKPPYLFASASVAGKKEGEGPLGEKIDLICEDPMLGEENWEKAESMLQIKAIQLALEKAGKMPQQIRYIFAGDLLGQLIATSFGVEELEIPLFGLYGACSTCGETLSLAAMTVSAGYADQVLAVTSSHFGSAEKQFRFPLGYGNSKTSFCDLDRHRKRSFSALSTEKPCKNHRNHDRESSGLRCEGFSEYGSLHGTGSGRYDLSESDGF